MGMMHRAPLLWVALAFSTGIGWAWIGPAAFLRVTIVSALIAGGCLFYGWPAKRMDILFLSLMILCGYLRGKLVVYPTEGN